MRARVANHTCSSQPMGPAHTPHGKMQVFIPHARMHLRRLLHPHTHGRFTACGIKGPLIAYANPHGHTIAHASSHTTHSLPPMPTFHSHICSHTHLAQLMIAPRPMPTAHSHAHLAQPVLVPTIPMPADLHQLCERRVHERRTAHRTLVQHTAQRPEVRRRRMCCVVAEQLGRHVARRATLGLHACVACVRLKEYDETENLSCTMQCSPSTHPPPATPQGRRRY